ncbi:RSORF1 [Gallid alphaherpesvirus 2]|uniref:Uncharacterized gene 82 protein n=3 Tax=Gallid alphaherpesvirus 2 TaxID=10390 RepID=VG82_GAHVM|nr:RecName: Full=Uncharacterized gene 82 protein [Marek's disease herpesvirus type 1 strain MD5]AAG14274.1 hypothetical protein [Gallid alphaherpesvirus 2]ACR02801.1 RSORF1 [synthetic construct]AEV55057.1 RSORF1 [Gallid herpesvirus 2 strain 814]AAG14285.1 hypothetical protein [Gallid alphaherpesvirus 2]AAS01709.1 hypothetical protein [Gallid alphaherpesvirus 2]
MSGISLTPVKQENEPCSFLRHDSGSTQAVNDTYVDRARPSADAKEHCAASDPEEWHSGDRPPRLCRKPSRFYRRIVIPETAPVLSPRYDLSDEPHAPGTTMISGPRTQ